LQKIELKQGQFIFGRSKAASELNMKESTVWTYMKFLEKVKSISMKSNNKFTVVTVDKWGDYQGSEEDDEQQNNNKITTKKQQNNTYKNVKNDKEKDYTSKIKDLLSRYVSISNFSKLNKEYWDVIRETRTTGKVQPSVIYNTMHKWEKYDPVVVQYALKTHIEAHAGKKEGYTIGIMRGTTKEEAEDRLNTKNEPFSKQPKQATQKMDIRDKEIAFSKWVNSGGDPEDFDWKTGKGKAKKNGDDN